jgi:membrane protein
MRGNGRAAHARVEETPDGVVRRLRPAEPVPETAQDRALHLGRTVRGTVVAAWEDRIFGLAAEFGFWMLLSLPPLLLAVLGILGFFGNDLPQGTIDGIETGVLNGARRVLVPDAVDSLIQPALHDILTKGRADVVSIGFLIALWSGSSAMATFVNTISIAYDRRDARGAVRSRLLALWLYLSGVLAFIVILPLLVIGPNRIIDLASPQYHALVSRLVNVLYWPVVGLGSVLLLATLYHLAVPGRVPWRRCLPGAVIALGLWMAGSYGLRVYFEAVFGHFSVYGPLASPIAVLLFLYVTALAVLFGAELNGELVRQEEARRLERENQ